ncbi:Immediate-early protein, putative [Perkinsus marinus ATCC 50983]|uniref:Immediate-early protein, putative n=1 Tax=Perkinsus marinus (strain ATCC 50983 / TXsc) TaxID=423536 RepID=C5KKM1_PERM5|nr:Immediate-early protein, putative [Perkinsus marinus ATCC 50983]EER15133.1 Immediate-early protein, putative [Perkinsus marinus ATCC 50983]|eukprot:XP_002783337.1 Immediate-early protein, putative [Perkinsus marinus ATCC 50983]
MAPKRKSTGRGGGAGRSNKRAKGANATGGSSSSSVVLPELEAPLFGDDLMIDDEDRQKLKEMTEVEREAVFNERYEQLVRYRERKKALERLKAKGVTALPVARSPKRSKAGEESDAESESSESSSGESESGSSSGDDNDDDDEEASSGSSESESSSGEKSDAEEDEEGVDAENTVRRPRVRCIGALNLWVGLPSLAEFIQALAQTRAARGSWNILGNSRRIHVSQV